MATQGQAEQVALDVQESCLRGERYGLLRNQLVRLPTANQKYEDGVKICNQAAGFGKSYSAYHSLVVAYGRSLQQLAADEPVSYDSAMEELAKSANASALAVFGKTVDGLGGVGLSRAAGALASTAAKWASLGYRRSRVNQAVKEGGPHVGIILDGLRNLVKEVYLPQLEAEEQRGQALYAMLQKVKPDQVALADIQWRQVQMDVAGRRRRAKRLSGKLDRLVAANDKIVELARKDADELEAEQLIAELRPLVKDILDVAEELAAVDWSPPPGGREIGTAPPGAPDPTTPAPPPP